MNKGKVTLIIVAVALALVAIFLFVNLQAKSKVFKDLKVKYKDYEAQYEELEVETTIINLNDVSFQVVSKMNDTIVLYTVDPLFDESGKEIGTEHKVTMEDFTVVCFAEQDCAYLTLE